MKKVFIAFILHSAFCILPLFSQSHIPLTIDSRAPTAPGIDPYQASRTVYRVTFMDGTNRVALTSLSPWMSWSSNAYSTGISTAQPSIVSSVSGIVDFAFTASALNPTFGPGRYLYEVGLRGSQGITVYRQGVLTLRGSPYAVGVPATSWSTNAVNWGAINWRGLPTTLAGYGIVDGVDLLDLLTVSNMVVDVAGDLATHSNTAAMTAHAGLGTAATNAATNFATSAQGTKADTALQVEADTNALAQLAAHSNTAAMAAHGGLGTAATNPAGAFATSAQGALASTALQVEADTNALAQLAAHSNTAAMSAHPGLGTAATNAATNFATSAQGTKADTALQFEADTNALAQLAAHSNTAAMAAHGGLGTAATNAATNFATAAQGALASTALQVEADTNALTQLAAHSNTAAMAAHGGLGTAATNPAGAFATAAQGALASTALQVEADTNALTQLAAHSNTAAMSAHPGLGTAATNPAGAFATAAQGALASTALQVEADTNALARLATHSNTAAMTAHAGLGTAATNAATNFATAAQGTKADTAFGWSNHAAAGYLSASTNLFSSVTVANRSILGTNISGLTQTVYTGALSSVTYTGVTTLVQGRTYVWGYTFIGSGTSTLSIAGQTLITNAIGSPSNYFTYIGTDTNLLLKLDGTGLAIGQVSALYVKQVLTGNVSVAGNIYVGGTMYWDGEIATNPALHIAASGTAVHGLGTAATNAATNFATAAQGALADTALQGEADTNALTQLAAHSNTAAMSAHGGLGTAATNAATNFATAAQGGLANTALQVEADTNALTQLAAHSNTAAITAHAGLGTAATNAATNFATSAQGTKADTALQVEFDTNALAQLAAHTNNESANIQHLMATEKSIATNDLLSAMSNDAGFVTSAVTNDMNDWLTNQWFFLTNNSGGYNAPD